MNDKALTALEFAVSSVKLGKSYLLLGTDSYLIDHVLDAIKNKLKKTDNVDIIIIYGDELKSNELNEHLDTFSIFSSAKLIIIRNAEKLEKKVLDTLGEYFDSPSEVQSLAIITEKTDIRFTAWKKIKSNSLTIECEPPRFGGAIRAWLDKTLKTMHKSMTPKAIEEFINRIELDYYSAANELTKLDLLTADAKAITDKDVLKSLGTTRIGTLIDFYRALGRKQLKPALEAMDKMLNAEWEPLQVFFQFNKFYTNILKLKLLKKAHLSDTEISSKHMHDIFQTQRREYLDFAANYTLPSLERIFFILLETDSQYKLSVADSNILLTNCLIRILLA